MIITTRVPSGFLKAVVSRPLRLLTALMRRAGAHELREMTQVREAWRESQLAACDVGVYGREAEVADMIGATALVEQDVPVGPADCAGIDIVDALAAIAFGVGPVLQPRRVEALNRGFGQQQVGCGPGFVGGSDIAVHRFACRDDPERSHAPAPH
jgi:hypothetical protein